MATTRYADRVRETTTTSGTGTVTLAGAVASYESFATAFSSGQDRIPYCLVDTANGGWEVGLGTFTTGFLSRDTILASSNSGSAIILSGGTTQVFNTAPAQFFNVMPLNPWWYSQFGGL